MQLSYAEWVADGLGGLRTVIDSPIGRASGSGLIGAARIARQFCRKLFD